MFIVTVEFVVRPQQAEAFHRAILDQARLSLNREPDCHQFDIGMDPQDRGKIFLYEVFTDETAFRAHLESDHFRAFDATVREWVERKSIQLWNRVVP